MAKMIDKRLYRVAAVFVTYIVALVPLYFIVGLANLHLGWQISYDSACFVLLVVAISVAGATYSHKSSKGAAPS
jgi:hypothetical protein